MGAEYRSLHPQYVSQLIVPVQLYELIPQGILYSNVQSF